MGERAQARQPPVAVFGALSQPHHPARVLSKLVFHLGRRAQALAQGPVAPSPATAATISTANMVAAPRTSSLTSANPPGYVEQATTIATEASSSSSSSSSAMAAGEIDLADIDLVAALAVAARSRRNRSVLAAESALAKILEIGRTGIRRLGDLARAGAVDAGAECNEDERDSPEIQNSTHTNNNNNHNGSSNNNHSNDQDMPKNRGSTEDSQGSDSMPAESEEAATRDRWLQVLCRITEFLLTLIDPERRWQERKARLEDAMADPADRSARASDLAADDSAETEVIMLLVDLLKVHKDARGLGPLQYRLQALVLDTLAALVYVSPAAAQAKVRRAGVVELVDKILGWPGFGPGGSPELEFRQQVLGLHLLREMIARHAPNAVRIVEIGTTKRVLELIAWTAEVFGRGQASVVDLDPSAAAPTPAAGNNGRRGSTASSSTCAARMTGSPDAGAAGVAGARLLGTLPYPRLTEADAGRQEGEEDPLFAPRFVWLDNPNPHLSALFHIVFGLCLTGPVDAPGGGGKISMNATFLSGLLSLFAPSDDLWSSSQSQAPATPGRASVAQQFSRARDNWRSETCHVQVRVIELFTALVTANPKITEVLRSLNCWETLFGEFFFSPQSLSPSLADLHAYAARTRSPQAPPEQLEFCTRAGGACLIRTRGPGQGRAARPWLTEVPARCALSLLVLSFFRYTSTLHGLDNLAEVIKLVSLIEDSKHRPGALVTYLAALNDMLRQKRRRTQFSLAQCQGPQVLVTLAASLCGETPSGGPSTAGIVNGDDDDDDDDEDDDGGGEDKDEGKHKKTNNNNNNDDDHHPHGEDDADSGNQGQGTPRLPPPPGNVGLEDGDASEEDSGGMPRLGPEASGILPAATPSVSSRAGSRAGSRAQTPTGPAHLPSLTTQGARFLALSALDHFLFSSDIDRTIREARDGKVVTCMVETCNALLALLFDPCATELAFDAVLRIMSADCDARRGLRLDDLQRELFSRVVELIGLSSAQPQRSLEILKATREVLKRTGVPVQKRRQLVEAGALIQAVSILNVDSGEGGIVVCGAVLQTLTAILAGSNDNKEFFRRCIGYDQLCNLMLRSEGGSPSAELFHLVLDALVDSAFDEERNYAFRNPDIVGLIFQLLPHCATPLQLEILDTFSRLLERSTRNQSVCASVGLLGQLLGMVTKMMETASRGDPVISRAVRLISVLGRHSISVTHLKGCLSLLRCDPGQPRPWISADMIAALRAMTERTGGNVFFDFDGSVESGLRVSQIANWPESRGYSFCTWLRVESFSGNPSSSSASSSSASASASAAAAAAAAAAAGAQGRRVQQQCLYSFRNATHTTGFEAFLGPSGIVVRTLSKGRINAVLFSGALEERKWYFLCIAHAAKKNVLSQATVKVFVNGEPLLPAGSIAEHSHAESVDFGMVSAAGAPHPPAAAEAGRARAKTMGRDPAGSAGAAKDRDKDSVSVPLKYPSLAGDALELNYLATSPSRDALFGQLGPVYFFDDALQAQTVRGIHELGPDYMYTFLATDAGGALAQPGLSEGQLSSRVFLALNAKVAAGDQFLDNSPEGGAGASTNVPVSADRLPGTRQCVTRNLKEILAAAGSVKVLLPLTLHCGLSAEGGAPGGPDPAFLASVLGLLGDVLAGSKTNCEEMHKCAGFRVLNHLLRTLAPWHFGQEVVRAVLNLVAGLSGFDALIDDAYTNLLYDARLWALAPAGVFEEVLAAMHANARCPDRKLRAYFRARFGVQHVLDMLRTALWLEPNPDSFPEPGGDAPSGVDAAAAAALASTLLLSSSFSFSSPSLVAAVVAASGQRPDPPRLRALRTLALDLIPVIAGSEVAPQELQALLLALQSSLAAGDSEAAHDLAGALFTVLCAQGAPAFEHLATMGGVDFVAGLLASHSEPIRICAIRLLALIAKRRHACSPKKRAFLDTDQVVPLLTSSLAPFPLTEEVFAALLLLVREEVRFGEPTSPVAEPAALRKGGRTVVYIFRGARALACTLQLLASAPWAVRASVMRELAFQCRSLEENVEKVLSIAGWETFLVNMFAAGSDPEAQQGADPGHRLTHCDEVRGRAIAILSDCVFFALAKLKGGWEAVDRMAARLHMFHERGVLDARPLLSAIYANLVSLCKEAKQMPTENIINFVMHLEEFLFYPRVDSFDSEVPAGGSAAASRDPPRLPAPGPSLFVDATGAYASREWGDNDLALRILELLALLQSKAPKDNEFTSPSYVPPAGLGSILGSGIGGGVGTGGAGGNNNINNSISSSTTNNTNNSSSNNNSSNSNNSSQATAGGNLGANGSLASGSGGSGAGASGAGGRSLSRARAGGYPRVALRLVCHCLMQRGDLTSVSFFVHLLLRERILEDRVLVLLSWLFAALEVATAEAQAQAASQAFTQGAPPVTLPPSAAQVAKLTRAVIARFRPLLATVLLDANLKSLLATPPAFLRDDSSGEEVLGHLLTPTWLRSVATYVHLPARDHAREDVLAAARISLDRAAILAECRAADDGAALTELATERTFAQNSGESRRDHLQAEAARVAAQRASAVAAARGALRLWRSVRQTVTGETGLWGRPAGTTSYFWKLDKCEDSQRQRRKLKRCAIEDASSFSTSTTTNSTSAAGAAATTITGPTSSSSTAAAADDPDSLLERLKGLRLPQSAPGAAARAADDEDEGAVAAAGSAVAPASDASLVPSSSMLTMASVAQAAAAAVAEVLVPAGADDNKIVYACACELVSPKAITVGRIELTPTHLSFFALSTTQESAINEGGVPVKEAVATVSLKDRRWALSSVKELYCRRYLLRRTAVELCLAERKRYLLNFTEADCKKVYSKILGLKPVNLAASGKTPAEMLKRSDATQRWVRRQMSNFDYLMHLNTIAGRTYLDLTQYPVFPWIIADYVSPTLDLTRPETFRDLSKPVGALDPARLSVFLERYNAFDDAETPRFHYGTHYSSAAIVIFYLLRLEPFTSLGKALQGGKFDHADRLFDSIPHTWQNVLHNTGDVKELIPEFFFLPEMLTNVNGLNLGAKQDGRRINHVELPPWAKSPEDFVRRNREALESEYVSQNLHLWIDLIFGFRQRGSPAVEAANIFYYLTYEGAVDIDKITDPLMRRATVAQIANFGQTPTQLFAKPHPRREDLGTTVFPTLDAALFGASQQQQQQQQQLNGSPKQGSIVKKSPSMQALAATLLGVAPPPPPPPPLVPYLDQHVTAFINEPVVFLKATPEKLITIGMEREVGVHRWSATTADGDKGTPFSLVLDPSLVIEWDRQAQLDRTGLAGPATKSQRLAASRGGGGRPIRRVPVPFEQGVHPGPALFAVSPDARHLFSCGHWDSSLKCTALESGRVVQSLVGHKDLVGCLALGEDGRTLVTGSRDTTVAVWDVSPRADPRSGHLVLSSPRHILSGHDDEVTAVAVSCDLDVVVSGSRDGAVVVHTAREGRFALRLGVQGKPRRVTALLVTATAVIVSYSMEDFSLELHSVNGKPLASVDAMERLHAFAATRGGVLFTGGEHRTLVARSLFDLAVLHRFSRDFERPERPITAIALSADDQHVLVGAESGKTLVFSVVPNQLFSQQMAIAGLL